MTFVQCDETVLFSRLFFDKFPVFLMFLSVKKSSSISSPLGFSPELGGELFFVCVFSWEEGRPSMASAGLAPNSASRISLSMTAVWESVRKPVSACSLRIQEQSRVQRPPSPSSSAEAQMP